MTVTDAWYTAPATGTAGLLATASNPSNVQAPNGGQANVMSATFTVTQPGVIAVAAFLPGRSSTDPKFGGFISVDGSEIVSGVSGGAAATLTLISHTHSLDAGSHTITATIYANWGVTGVGGGGRLLAFQAFLPPGQAAAAAADLPLNVPE